MKLLIIGFIFLLFSYWGRKKYDSYLWLLFVLLVMGLQSNVGGDYVSYKEMYDGLALRETPRSHLYVEVGWYYMTKFLAQYMSFELFVFLLSLVEYLILARFINRYVKKPYRFVAGLIFFFNMNMMLFQMKGMRQGFAIELVLAAFILFDSRKLLAGLGVSALAVSMHTSSLVVVPFILLFYFIKKTSWWNHKFKLKFWVIPLSLLILYIFVVTNKELLIDIWRPLLLAMNLEGYEGYFGEMEFTQQHFLFYIYGGLIVSVLSYYLNFTRGSLRFMVVMAIIGQFLSDFFLGMGSLFRLSLFFSIFSIIAIPCFANFLYRRKYRVLSMLFIVFCVAYAWRTFMPWVFRPVVDGFYTYRFIFE